MRNIKRGSKVAIGYANWEKLDGYRFTGTAEVHTEGKYYDEAVEWAKGKMGVPKAAVIFHIEEIYTLRSGATTGTKITEKLIEAVQVLGRGEALLAPEVTRRVIDRFAATSAPVDAKVDVLTERELDTLRCLARGLSNAEIAEELYISAETVKTHVSNILTKLGLRDRINAVIWAFEHGLVPRR